tara:strand:- start:773 stop:1321 length:549 start_codon:yes stop_codon:yes gene_type:complete
VLYLNVEESARWLADGKILIHPTEGVWGIGCDAKNKKAIDRVFDLKNRDSSKKFILLSPSIKSVKEFCLINDNDMKILQKEWPGPTTFIMDIGSNKYKHISSLERHAVRVSAHLPIVDLLGLFRSEIVSTSANLSGEKELKTKDDIASFFNYDDVAIFDENLGTLSKPTKIFDLKLNSYIRE